MGWTSYNDFRSVKDAVHFELRGIEILAESGAWYLCRNSTGNAFLVHAMSRREGGQTWIKLVDSSMGPVATPPQTIFRRFLREAQGQTFGTYEQAFIDRVEAAYAHRNSIPTLKPGNVFMLDAPLNYTDGVSEDTFRYVRKFTACRITDNVMVRMPRDFRTRVIDVAPARFTA